MRVRRAARRLLAVLALTLVALVAGCSDGGDEPTPVAGVSTATPTPTEATPTPAATATPTPDTAEALRAYGEWLLSGLLFVEDLPEAAWDGPSDVSMVLADVPPDQVELYGSMFTACAGIEATTASTAPPGQFAAARTFGAGAFEAVTITQVLITGYDDLAAASTAMTPPGDPADFAACVADQIVIQLNEQLGADATSVTLSVKEATGALIDLGDPDAFGMAIDIAIAVQGLEGVPGFRQSIRQASWIDGDTVGIIQVMQIDGGTVEVDPAALYEIVRPRLAEALAAEPRP